MVSKFSPTRLGRRKDSFVKSHVPSPTCRVSDEYEADPGGERVSAGAMTGDYLGRGCARRAGRILKSVGAQCRFFFGVAKVQWNAGGCWVSRCWTMSSELWTCEYKLMVG